MTPEVVRLAPSEPKRQREFAAEVRDGKAIIFARDAFDREIARREGRRVWLRILDERQVRTDQQNRYWWVAIVATIRDLWWKRSGAALPLPKEAVHAALVQSLCGLVDTPLGAVRVQSKTLTTAEFTDLIEGARAYALETFGVNIPTPAEWMEAA